MGGQEEREGRHGTAVAEATETALWRNTRVRGIGRPSFPVELLDPTGAATGD